MAIRRWATALIVVLVVLVGGAVALAQNDAPVSPSETERDVDEPQLGVGRRRGCPGGR